ncbi:efflux RND transporter permease subunit [uncultured Stenotrophomonas sp.]|nr:efflux RND transporter permease subunit [uncultured Stenotrophomonas sp.]
MDFSRFFIDRPIFAAVLSIVIFAAGLITIPILPISEYPEVVPPSVVVRTVYPGANPKVIAETVATPLEEAINGVEGMMYLKSVAGSDGVLQMTVTFRPGTDPDAAAVKVQNRVAQAQARLPEDVRRQGVTTQKQSPTFLMVVHLTSPQGKYDTLYLRNYARLHVKDALARIPGVGDAQIFGGGDYAMRAWLDPDKVASRGLTASDVVRAMREQNVQVSAGQLGAEPLPDSKFLTLINAQGRLKTEKEFGDIVLKSGTDGEIVRLSDVARLELGAGDYTLRSQLDGKNAVGIGIFQSPGANALEIRDQVISTMDEMQKTMPADVKYEAVYDTTIFVRDSIKAVVSTLLEAIALVVLVVILFLQTWRASIIPLIAVPVSVVGTFAALYLLGFSINTLSLFGLVLAIGIVVDDAIVVVENVERLIVDEHLSPKDAARKSMDEISGALIGIGMVLSAVFLPMAFFGGSTGVIYRQFSITIVSAMVLSVLVALILTPALCATILKPHDPKKKEGNGPLARFFRWFNDKFERGQNKYENGVKRTVRSWKRSMVVFAVIVLGVGGLFATLPSGFLPDEDQGTVLALVQGPAGATTVRTDKGIDLVRNHFLKDEAANVAGVFTVNGFSFAGQGQNAGIAFVNLKPWEDRPGAENRAQAIVGRAMGTFSQYKDGMIFALIPPAVQELGNATGFDAQLVDTGGVGHAKLLEIRNMMLGMAAQNPALAQVRPLSLDDAPQLKVVVDEDKARALNLDLATVNSTIATAWGGGYVNDFIDRGRVKRVYVQNDAPYRLKPEDIGALYVRSTTGQMVPFNAFTTQEWSNAPVQLTRYNGQPAMQIQGSPAPGKSTGAAMEALQEIHAKLPPGTTLEWTGLSYEEKLSGGQAPALYGLSLLIVFLCLAALYESWSVPISVLLVVPLGIIGALFAAWITGLNNDIYLQVGLITTIGVSAKNAILIVEFAEERIAEGMKPFDAAVQAAKLRLRPILMTSLAFIFGVLPLAISTGAGAGGQNAIGRAVVGGMLTATVFAIFLVPMFFVVVLRLFGHGDDAEPAASDDPDRGREDDRRRDHDSNQGRPAVEGA